MTHGTSEFALTLPITQAAYQTASAFADQQPTAEKAEQVRLNTLAVWVTDEYLQLMEIPTNRSVSDSWNPLMRVCADVADLELPGVGRLECRAVRPNATVCAIPPETWEERVGYVVVQVDELAQEAHILGFVPQVNEMEELPLNRLRSPEELLDHLYDLRQTVPSPVATVKQAFTTLSQWLQGAIEEGWQAVEDVLNPAEPAFAYGFRTRATAVRQAKRLSLGNEHPTIVLVVDIRPEADHQFDIRVQLHPTDDQPGLSPGLQMTVLDANGEETITAQATGMEDFLQLQIEGEPGEAFSVDIHLNDIHINESFVI